MLARIYYFGLIFLTLSISSVPSVTKQLNLEVDYDWLKNGDLKNWKKLRELVMHDAQRMGSSLKTKNPKKITETGHFFKPPHNHPKIFIYCHNDYATFSSNTLALIVNGVSVNICDAESIDLPTPLENHYILAPYLYDNRGVLRFYQERLDEGIKTEEQEQEQLKLLNTLALNLKLLKELLSRPNARVRDLSSPYICPVASGSHAVTYNEDDWTQRLYNCLMKLMPNTEVDLLSNEKKFSNTVNQYTKSCGQEEYFLLRGAPDIVISRQGAIVSIDTDVDDSEVSEGESIESESSEDISARGTMSLFASVPNKCGELVAQLHFFIVSKFIRRICSSKCRDEATCRGLLLDRSTGGIHVTCTANIVDVARDEDPALLAVDINTSRGGVLDTKTLSQHLCHLVQRRHEHTGSLPAANDPSNPPPTKKSRTDGTAQE